MLKAIIFDLDGTLTEFRLDYLSARKRALEELRRRGLATPNMSQAMSFQTLLRLTRPRATDQEFEEVKAAFHHILEEVEAQAANAARAQPGALEVLRRLRARGLKLALVTNNGRRGTATTLELTGLKGLFDVVITREDAPAMKPEGDGLREALARLGVNPQEALFVGDGTIDILAARRAGVPSVAVATGPIPLKELLKARPDYLAATVREVSDLVEALNHY
jgi:HAD superfamily hydrolase (TIGR01509 family)